ncbi:MAG: hypothetical protein ACOX8V_04025 [Thermoleophilia bacterium]|jgi:hypothetical protein
MQVGITPPEISDQEELLRRARRRAALCRRRRIRFGAGFALLCLLVATVVIVLVGDGSTTVNAQTLLAGTSSGESAPVAASGEERPAFARLGDRNLILPVAAKDATIIAYQPVNDERALVLTPIGTCANGNAVARFFRGLFTSEPAVRYYQLDGEGASPTNSVLIGAPVGSVVTSPVSGVVTGVKEYKLYGKYDDVQIEIRPEELSGTTVTLMFINDPVVSIGEVVTARKTQLGKVRECPPELAPSLGRYTHDSGAHIHLTVTEKPVG